MDFSSFQIGYICQGPQVASSTTVINKQLQVHRYTTQQQAVAAATANARIHDPSHDQQYVSITYMHVDSMHSQLQQNHTMKFQSARQTFYFSLLTNKFVCIQLQKCAVVSTCRPMPGHIPAHPHRNG